MYHHPQIHPIFKKGKGNAAALLLHGFTGTPDIMRPLANHLHDELGFTVSAPLLAGHGGTREQLAAATWQDWYGTCRGAFRELRERHQQICVVGLSLGGVLGLKLAEDEPDAIQALACLATPLVLETWVRWTLPFVRNTPLRWFYRYQKKMGLDVKNESAKRNVWNIGEMSLSSVHSLMKLQGLVRKSLPKVTCPVLLVHGRSDATAPYENMNLIAKGVSSVVAETVTLENSYHLVTVDHDRDTVNRKVGEFFARFTETLTSS